MAVYSILPQVVLVLLKLQYLLIPQHHCARDRMRRTIAYPYPSETDQRSTVVVTYSHPLGTRPPSPNQFACGVYQYNTAYHFYSHLPRQHFSSPPNFGTTRSARFDGYRPWRAYELSDPTFGPKPALVCTGIFFVDPITPDRGRIVSQNLGETDTVQYDTVAMDLHT